MVESSRVLVSDKFKYNENGFKHFIGYFRVDDAIRPLYVVLTLMSGYIKYFDNGGKNMSYLIKDENAYLKYTKIWNKIKKLLSVKFDSQPIYVNKYIKTKVKTFGGTINTLFSNNRVPKEKNHYICVLAICIDSVLKIEGKSYPQVYLEQCKYQRKTKKILHFIGDEVILSSSDTDDLDE